MWSFSVVKAFGASSLIEEEYSLTYNKYKYHSLSSKIKIFLSGLF